MRLTGGQSVKKLAWLRGSKYLRRGARVSRARSSTNDSIGMQREAALRRAQERLRERAQSGLRSKLRVPSVGSGFSGLLSQSDLPSVAESAFAEADRPREQALQPLKHTSQIKLGYETLPFAPSAAGAKKGEYPQEPLNAREHATKVKQVIPPLFNIHEFKNGFLKSSAQFSTHMSSTQMPDKPSESTTHKRGWRLEGLLAGPSLPAGEEREHHMGADSGGAKWRDDLMSREGNASDPGWDTDLSPRTLILAACSPQRAPETKSFSRLGSIESLHPTIPISRQPSTFSSSHAQSLQPALAPVVIYVRGAGLTAGMHCALP